MAPLTARRRQLWIALSELYLDTEMQGGTHQHIARVFNEAGYTPEQAWRIDRREVFPVLCGNLCTVAGVWGGFGEEWLIDSLERYRAQRSWLRDRWFGLHFRLLGHHSASDRDAITRAYYDLFAAA